MKYHFNNERNKMSWGTYYKHEGYLSHIGKNEIFSRRKECRDINDMIWHKILAYMASAPLEYAKDEDGHEYPWQEFIALKLREFRSEIEENAMMMARLDDCADVMNENPENVTEG